MVKLSLIFISIPGAYLGFFLGGSELLGEASAIAISFPDPEVGIAVSTVRELCGAFDRFAKAQNRNSAVQAQEEALSILRESDAHPHEPTKRHYCGALVDSVCRAYLDGWDALMPTLPDVASYLSTAPSVAWDESVSTIIQPFGNYFSEAMRELSADEPDQERARRCIEILEFYSEYDSSRNDYTQVIELIRSRLEQE